MNFKFIAVVFSIMSISCSTIAFAMVDSENDGRTISTPVKKTKDAFEDSEANNEESLNTMFTSILEKLEREIRAEQSHTQDATILMEKIESLMKESIKTIKGSPEK